MRDDEGLSLTSVTCTLLDLASVLTPHQLQRVCHRAELLRLLDTAAVADRARGRSGARALRAALDRLAIAEPDVTRSELEERFLGLIRRARLPHPRVNAWVAGHEVDFLWPTARLVAETDFAAAHLTATAFERDRARDAELAAAGFRVVRFTWRQVHLEQRRVAQTLRALLRGSSSG